MDRLPFIVLVFLAGAFYPVQAVVNARLAQSVGGPVWAAFASFLGGTVILLVAALVMVGPPRMAALAETPWYVWTGGVFGALLVFAMALSAPRLGTGALLALIVCAQMMMALALDRFGILQPVRALGPWQVAGTVLLLAGVVMVVFGPRD